MLAGKLAEGDESVLGSVEALSLVSMSLSGAEPDYQVRMLYVSFYGDGRTDG